MTMFRALCCAAGVLCCSLPLSVQSAESDADAVEMLPVEALSDEPVNEGTEIEKLQSQREVVQLEAITVVATRTARVVHEVPQSVEVLGREDIERLQPSDLGDLLESVPGVDLMGGPRSDAESVVIRGLGGISGTRVVTLVDGARQELDRGVLSRLSVDPALLESVEILKGPSSMLYGSGAIGGVISMTTRDPSDLLAEGRRFGARLRAGYESAAESQIYGGTLFGAIGSVEFLADLDWRRSDDFRQGEGTTMPYSGHDDFGSLGILSWRPSDNSLLRISSTGFESDRLTLANPTQPIDDDSNRPTDREQKQRFTSVAYGLRPQGIWNDFHVGLHMSDYHTEELRRPAEGSTWDEFLELIGLSEEEASTPRVYDFETLGGDVRTGFGFDLLSQQLTIGGEYYHNDGQAREGDEPINNFPDASQQIYGVYLQDEFELGHKLHVVAGLRYDHYESDPGAGIDADAISDSELSPQIGVTYLIGKGVSVAALYAEAFRAPSLRESYSSGTHFLGNEFVINPDLLPESAANAELSLRYDSPSPTVAYDRLSMSVTGFHNEVEDFMDLIVTVETEVPSLPCLIPNDDPGCVAPGVYVGGSTTTVNLPRARLDGLEASLEYMKDWFELRADYSQVRGKNADTDEWLSGIPADQLRVSAGVRWQTLYSSLVFTHAWSQDRVPPEQEDRVAISQPTPGYSLVDWQLHWQPRWSVLNGASFALAVENLTDRRYRNHLTFDETFYDVGRNLKVSVALPI